MYLIASAFGTYDNVICLNRWIWMKWLLGANELNVLCIERMIWFFFVECYGWSNKMIRLFLGWNTSWQQVNFENEEKPYTKLGSSLRILSHSTNSSSITGPNVRENSFNLKDNFGELHLGEKLTSSIDIIVLKISVNGTGKLQYVTPLILVKNTISWLI